MGLSLANKASIAFKNLLGKSMTSPSKGIGNEAEGIKFNVSANTIYVDEIPLVPGAYSIEVLADLVPDPTSIVSGTSNPHAFFANWPATAPSGYTYGSGVLSNIAAGDRIINSISDAYGPGYAVVPYLDGGATQPIPSTDPSLWMYQYQSGVYFRENEDLATPLKLKLYWYSGEFLSDSASGNKQTFSITGDGTTTVFTINHNMGSDAILTIFEVATHDEVIASITHTSVNALNIEFNSAPALNEEFKIIMI